MASIRPYRVSDRDALYEVCLRTGADGEDATAMFSVPQILGEVFVGPYLEFHPELAWVIEHEGVASAYVLGVPDTRAFAAQCERDWWPALRAKYPLGSFPADSLDEEVVGLIHTPPVAADWIVTEYPAHLHIDLVPEVQGLKLGTAMIRTLLDALRDRDVPAVHLGVSSKNVRAIGFYLHLGFTVLDERTAEARNDADATGFQETHMGLPLTGN